MQMSKPCTKPSRRKFLHLLGAGTFALALPGSRLFSAQQSGAGKRSGSKALRGIFPIAQTPFTQSDQLDLDALVEELRFIDRGRVPGFVWPQLASEWSTLSEPERLAGMKVIGATGKALRPAIVLGVQGPNVAAAVKYAKHAHQVGADALISLPPTNQNDPKAVIEYYKEVGSATPLPLFVQAVGNMSVDLLVQLYRAVPTLRYVKDEAGQPLMRIGPLRRRTEDQLKVFTGAHGRTLIDELHRGFAGSMPAAAFADLYAAAWDLWHAGKTTEAMAVFAQTAMLITEVTAYGLEALKYILCLRGVFKTYRTRQPQQSPRASAAARTTAAEDPCSRLDDTAKQVLRKMLAYVKPHLRA